MKVLVVGLYLSDRPNLHAHISEHFGSSEEHIVTQRWIELTEETKEPKYPALNRLLFDVERFDYVIVSDDDIRFDVGWLDSYLAVQHELGFVLAQPARTRGSYFWYELNRQQEHMLARQTRFVEIGPLFSVARVAYPHIFPFDERSPHGFGYEFIWSYRLKAEQYRQGIIDAYPVDHSFRPHGETFDYRQAEHDMAELLGDEPHLRREECLVELFSYPLALAVPD